MSSLKEYLEGYAGGVKSLLTGMGTSMKVFCQKKITEQYPENRHTTLHIPERHRALLTLPADEEGNHKCIACGLCQMNCPNSTIKLTTEMRETEEGKKKEGTGEVRVQPGLLHVLHALRERLPARRDQVYERFRERRVRKGQTCADTQQKNNGGLSSII